MILAILRAVLGLAESLTQMANNRGLINAGIATQQVESLRLAQQRVAVAQEARRSSLRDTRAGGLRDPDEHERD